MSNRHASLSSLVTLEMGRIRFPLDGLIALRRAVMTFGNRLTTGMQQRWIMRRLGRFSDHRLRDIGFERDWDGTVLPIINGQ